MAEDVKVPEGWDVSNLGKLASFINGYAFKPEDWKEEGLPIIRIEQLKDPNAKYDYSDKKLPDIYLIDNGDLIFSWSATLAIKLWDRGKAYLNQHLYKVIPNSTIKKRFLKCLLEHKIEDLSKETHGSTMKHITRTFLLNFRVTYPKSKLEQRKIAEILETIDNAIEKTDAIIEKYKRIKQGLMQDLLTRGIAESDELGVMSYELRDEKKHRFWDSPLGRIPEEWEVVELEAISFNITDGKHGDCQDEENSGYYFVSAKDIYDGKIHYENVRQITKRDFEEAHKRTKLEPFDIILTNSGTIGKIAIIKDQPETYKTTFQKSVAIIKLNTDLANPYFIAQKLESIIKKLINESYGSAQQNLLLRDLRRLLILLPPLPEQHHIASILSQIDEAIEKEQKYKEKLHRCSVKGDC